MKKLLGILFLLTAFCLPSHAFMGSSFDVPVSACVSHILVKDQAQALKLKSEIKNYDDFAELARIYSDCPSGRNGGYLGCFGKGKMVKAFEEAAFKEPLGEVVGPVKTEFGYHLLWISRRF